MSIANLDKRTSAGSIGLYGGLLGFVLVAGTLLILLGPADSTLVKFVVAHKMLFRGMLCAAFFGSVLTLLCSLFGKGKQRGFGAALSIVNILISISILGAGE
jgi:hypothetical protein